MEQPPRKVQWAIDNFRSDDLTSFASDEKIEDAANRAVLLAADQLSDGEMDALLGRLSPQQVREWAEETSRKVNGKPDEVWKVKPKEEPFTEFPEGFPVPGSEEP